MKNWEASWDHVERNWDSQDGTKLSQVEANLINFGTNLEPSWALLGQVWPCWGHVGTRVGPSWSKLSHLGTTLGPTGAKLGPCWGQFGAKLGQVGAKLGQVGPSWGQVGPMLADFSRKLAITTQGYPTCRRKSSKMEQKSQTQASKPDFGTVLSFMLAPKISKKSDVHPRGAK